jgi:hypothetical protein
MPRFKSLLDPEAPSQELSSDYETMDIEFNSYLAPKWLLLALTGGGRGGSYTTKPIIGVTAESWP